MRRALVAKNTAYPQKIVNKDYIKNIKSVNTVGGIIEVSGTTLQDIKQAFSTTNPAQMSADVEKLQQDLINTTRALAGVSESASGDIKPDEASGKAILAVQQASQLPLVDQLASLKAFIEGNARIWLNMIIIYNPNGIVLQEENEDYITGEKIIKPVKVEGATLKELQASVKVDITPVSTADRYAQELCLENLLKGGWFAPDKIAQLKLYTEALPDNSAMPKQRILQIIKKEEAKQKYIAQLQSQAQMMMQNANNFINNDPDAQAQQIADTQTMQNQNLSGQSEQNNIPINQGQVA